MNEYELNGYQREFLEKIIDNPNVNSICTCQHIYCGGCNGSRYGYSKDGKYHAYEPSEPFETIVCIYCNGSGNSLIPCDLCVFQ